MLNGIKAKKIFVDENSNCCFIYESSINNWNIQAYKNLTYDFHNGREFDLVVFIYDSSNRITKKNIDTRQSIPPFNSFTKYVKDEKNCITKNKYAWRYNNVIMC